MTVFIHNKQTLSLNRTTGYKIDCWECVKQYKPS